MHRSLFISYPFCTIVEPNGVCDYVKGKIEEKTILFNIGKLELRILICGKRNGDYVYKIQIGDGKIVEESILLLAATTVEILSPIYKQFQPLFTFVLENELFMFFGRYKEVAIVFDPPTAICNYLNFYYPL